MAAERDTPDFLPESPGLLVQARALVARPMAMALLRELSRRNCALAVRRRRDPDVHVFARILECSAETISIEIEPTSPSRPGSRVAATSRPQVPACGYDEDYVAVAYLDGIKIQFDARLRGQGDEPTRLLRGPAPIAVYRLQRRDAYRVPTEPGQGRCVLRHAPGEELSLDIVDLSVRGTLLAWRASWRPAVGSVWEHSRIEFPDRNPLPCMLVAARIDESDDPIRVGCEFGPMPPEVERALQVLVDDLQRASLRTR